VPKHELYQELSTLAVIGEVSPAEMQDLREHLNECPDCRREYQEFVQLVLPQLSASDESVPPVSGSTADDAEARRARFLERAQAAGISFSAKALDPPESKIDAPKESPAGAPVEMQVRKHAALGWVYRGSIAAALLVAVAGAGYLAAIGHRQQRNTMAAKSTAPSSVVTASSTPSTSESPELSAQLAADTRRIGTLEASLSETSRQLAAARASAATLAGERSELQREMDAEKQVVAAAEQQDQASQQTAAGLQAKLTDLQTRADNARANASLDQLRVTELSSQVKELNTSLDRERDMLSAGREMRDMMAARNLHIVDVIDTDARGRNRAAFGRIFFAENRQLVFYAYDLNEKRLEDARYDYRIWGQKEGQPHTARSLGIFYSDDKTEHRWVFKCEDPKTLSEIDSVFVTLEPVTADPARPRGPQLMYAYLRGQPNHP
jgi:cytoskeletal protein RodZ